MNVFVRCMLSHGMFSGEWAVSIKAIEGKLSLFVDEYFIEPETQPENGEAVPGRLRALMIEEHDEAPLVQLPVQSSPAANRVRIPRGELEAA